MYKLVRSSAEQIANIAGDTRVAGFFNSVGIIDEVGDFYLGARDFFSSKDDPSAADSLYRLDFWKNDKGQPLTGFDEFTARLELGFLTTLRRLNDQMARINRGIMRVERGVAQAR